MYWISPSCLVPIFTFFLPFIWAPFLTYHTVLSLVQLILKWGGDLTKLGENQAIKLGKQFRQEIYPDAP